MPVWPFLLALAVTVFIAGLVMGQRRAASVAGVMVCAYVAGWLLKMSGTEYDLSGFAVIWICAAAICLTLRDYGISAILLAVSACYVWAWAVGAPWEIGSLPFVVSDILAVAAMISLIAGMRHANRDHSVGRDFRRRDFVLGGDRGIHETQAAKAAK